MHATPTTQDSTVYTLAAQLLAETPDVGDRERIARALDLVPTVERTAVRGLFLVPSATTEGGCYHIRGGRCDCPDAQRRDALACKHSRAVQLFEMLERAETDREQLPAILVEPEDEAILFALTAQALALLGEPCAIEPLPRVGITRLPTPAHLVDLANELCGPADVCERPRPALRLVAVDGAALQ